VNIKKELKKKNVGITKFNPDIITIIENMDYKQRKGLCNRLIKSTHEVEIPVMEEAYKEGILTKKEYEKEYRHKLVDPTSGADSFPELMQAVMFNKRNPDSDKIIFVSTNSMILKNRKKLSKRFNIEIKDPKEALEMIIEGKEELPDAM
jgi:hypothetical protein